MDFNEKPFQRLVDYAAVYLDSRVVFTFRNGVEVGRRFKARSDWGIVFLHKCLQLFFARGNRMSLCMEIGEELRYNFDDGKNK